jgi:hypothetical protein
MKSHRIHAAACSRGHSLLALFASDDAPLFSLSGCQKMPLTHQAMALNKTVQEKFVIPEVRTELVIRSPQGVLAYLGELDRMSLKDSARNKVPRIGPDDEPLFQQLIDLQEKKIDQNPSSIRVLGN